MVDLLDAAAPPVRSRRFDGAAIALLALVVRLPALFADRHLTFDDGVYGSAALSMRHGSIPFRDVYSPQGPAHLATVWFFDLLGGRTAWSPRIASVVAGIAICVAVWSILTVVANPRTARWGGIVLAISGSLGWVTVPLAGDGIAIAWAAVAIAVTARAQGRLHYIAFAGCTMGMALSTKVLVVPAAFMVVAVLFVSGASWKTRATQLLVCATSVIVVVGAWFAVFRPSLVWDQSVRYHASTPRITSMSDNVVTLANAAVHRDFLLVAAFGCCMVAGWRTRRSFTATQRLFIVANAGWFVATAILLIAQKATFRAHVSHLVVPVVVLCALLKPLRETSPTERDDRALARIAFVCLGIVVTVVQFRGLLIPTEYSTAERSAVTVLHSLPANAFVIADEPGLAWIAHKEIPAWLVDPGIKRFFGDDLRVGPRSVYASLADPRVCAVVVWTYRYGSLLPLLAQRLKSHSYVAGHAYGTWTAPDGSRGPRRVWIRTSCSANDISSR